MKNPTAIASFESEAFAAPVARKLCDAGFDARVRGSLPSTAKSGLWPGVHHVIVPAMQTARALSWCREFDAAESLLAQAIRCPGCGSTRVTTRLRDQPGTNDPIKTGRVFRCDACYSAWVNAPILAFVDRPAAA